MHTQSSIAQVCNSCRARRSNRCGVPKDIDDTPQGADDSLCARSSGFSMVTTSLGVPTLAGVTSQLRCVQGSPLHSVGLHR